MKLFFHYCTFGFSNCYVLGSDDGPVREALVIDPGSMDEQILSFIEGNGYAVRAVLVTHDHLNHVHGLRTLRRIYDAEIYAVNHVIQEIRTNLVRDGDTVTLGAFKAGVISVPGHSSDSAVFRIGSLLFTGDSLSAGLVGRTASSYGAAIQMNALRSKILSLPGNYMVFPGHGPPTTLEAERHFNAGIQFYDQTRNQRPVFKLDI
ncbi:MAG: MBL fold metallo-hydrolase [Treponema sp.]|jgi:glyoxylase-like metal-dependent hydrolase (beta-lactamase superfamily II)|nr:MBL fold metallo-hydrolase [Treponema sp.]